MKCQKIISHFWKIIRHWRRIILGIDVPVWVNIHLPVESMGSSYGGWQVFLDSLSECSVVYAFGIGEDISFEIDLIQRFGMNIHSFDPTPRSLDWLNRQTLPPQLVVHPWGVANYDGKMTFFPPENPAHVSFSISRREKSENAVVLPVKRLSTVMQTLGHNHIDLLKLDVEGSEYDVLDDLIDQKITVDQILVEFHHRFPNIDRQETCRAIRRLRQSGYRLFSISESYEEYGFIHSATFGQS